MSSQYRFNFLHFMPYTRLPPEQKKYDSLWVNFPRRFSDPTVAHALYADYLAELVHAERVGFDALVLTEHHNNLEIPIPSVMAAALIPQTRRARICIWGTPPNLTYPSRLAEEYSLLDVLSGGRLEVAFPLGTPMEYWANAVNPVTSREQHRESIEIIIKAWTADEPTTHYGEYYTYRYLNTWPRTYQRPYPPCYIVGTGSLESIEIAAEFGFGYSAVFVPKKRAQQLNALMRERAASYGHQTRPDQLPLGVIIYVAETEEQAHAEFDPHVRFFFEDILRTTAHFQSPPGYHSVEQMRARAKSIAASHGGFDPVSFKELNFVAVGTPEQVSNQLGEWGDVMGSSHFNLIARMGDMPHWKVIKNLSLIAEEVIPRLRRRAPGTVAVAAS